MNEREITVVGGGLAGLSLGIALRRRGIAVTLHEAGCYPRHRVCGEFIRGVAPETLRALGIVDCLAGARSHRNTAWFGASGNLLTQTALPRPAFGISRHLLDQRLADLFAELGGVLHPQSRISPAEGEGAGWVWSAGRRAEKDAGWLGLKMHFTDFPLRADLEMHLGRGGYVGLTGVEAGRVNACGLFRLRKATTGRGGTLLFAYLEACGLGALADRLREATADESSFTGVGAFRLGRQRVDEGRCVIGDAERMIPPFTGNGMSMAFESAECALGPLVDFSRGGVAWSDCRQRIAAAQAARFRGRVEAARFLHPWLIGPTLPLFTRGLLRTRLVPIDLITRLLS